MKLTKGVISRDKAFELAPDYVNYIEARAGRNISKLLDQFNNVKRGKKALTFFDNQWVIVKISSVNHNDFRAIDGPIVRVSNGEGSWRVDGCGYCWLI